MKRFIKITSIIALCLILVGIGLAGCGFFMGGIPNFVYNWDTHEATTATRSVQKTSQDLDSFENLDLDVDYADIRLCYGDDYGIQYNKDALDSGNIKNENDTLKIRSTSKNTSHIINFTPYSLNDDTSDITITVPKNTSLKDIVIHNASGDCTLSDFTCDTLSVTCDYGDVELNRITTGKTTLKLSSGDLETHKSNLANCNMRLLYGDVKLENTQIEKLISICDSGDFDASDYTSKDSQITLNYGSLDMEKSNITSLTATLDSGDCELELSGKPTDYNWSLSADSGTITVGDSDYENHYQEIHSTDRSLQITANYGDIDVEFKN